MRWFLIVLAACSAPQARTTQSQSPTIAVAGHVAGGSIQALTIDGDRIAAIVPGEPTAAWLWPPIVDSHVHLSYWPVADRLAAHGVAAVVDLAAPERTLGEPSPIRVLAAGPMLTHDNGYPLDAWGADGYGLGCGDAPCVTAAIDRLAARGARVIKLALDEDGLAPALVAGAITAAHAHHLPVAVHALTDDSAARAAAAGADILAHTPVEPLSDATVTAWRGRAVISTLAAFGGSAAAIDNLRRLRAAGVLVLYGTDLGNLRDDGPSAREMELLRRAGLDDAAITNAMTTAPIAFWKLPFGELAAGAEATLLVLDGDPRRDASVLRAPHTVLLHGRSPR